LAWLQKTARIAFAGANNQQFFLYPFETQGPVNDQLHQVQASASPSIVQISQIYSQYDPATYQV
jgi:hypothetical protein